MHCLHSESSAWLELALSKPQHRLRCCQDVSRYLCGLHGGDAACLGVPAVEAALCVTHDHKVAPGRYGCGHSF